MLTSSKKIVGATLYNSHLYASTRWEEWMKFSNLSTRLAGRLFLQVDTGDTSEIRQMIILVFADLIFATENSRRMRINQIFGHGAGLRD